MFNSRYKPTDKKIVYDERKLYNYGINRLSVRDYGRNELKLRMSRFQEDTSMVDTVLDRLETQGYLSEERRIKALFNQFSGRESVNKIKNRMLQKGLDRDMIDELIISKQEPDKSPERDTAVELLQKKFRSYDTDDMKKVKEKMTRFLAGKGFKYDDIKKAMTQFFEVD